MKARVFISCGQNHTWEGEVETARAVANRLSALGFDPYIAAEVHSPRSLVENIYSQLRDSEYFLFIHFKRERLDDSNEHRGSLFSHQELAIASFDGLELLAFQEDGVKRLDGIVRFLQINPIPFADRNCLVDIVVETVR